MEFFPTSFLLLPCCFGLPEIPPVKANPLPQSPPKDRTSLRGAQSFSDDTLLSFRHGFNFAIPVVIVGLMASVFGLLMLFSQPIGGVLLAVAGAFLWTNSGGMQIDRVHGRFREFDSLYGIKNGEWKSLDTVPYLSILLGKKGFTMYSQSNRSASTAVDVYQVCLLTETHRSKYPVHSFESKEEAEAFAVQLAAQLQKKIVAYDPKVSAGTQARRGY